MINVKDFLPVGDFSICQINPLDNYDKTIEYPFIPMDSVKNNYGGISYFEKRKINGSGLVSFKKHDTIVAKITPCSENGKVAFIDDLPEDNALGFGSTEFIVFRPNKDNVVPKYLYLLLSSHKIHGLAISLMEGTTGRQRIPQKAYKKRILGYFPPVSKQKAIAGVLSKVDEAIKAAEKSIEAAERLKTSMIQNLLPGLLKPDNTWRNENEFYLDDRFGKVPKGWVAKPLKELAAIQRGKFSHRPRNEPRFYGGEHPFIQTSDVVNSVFYLKKHTQSLSDLGVAVSRRFEKGTIIITIAANIGDVALTQYDVFFPDSLIGINPNQELITSKFLLMSLMAKKQYLDQVSTESAQKNINYSNLRPLLICYPKSIDEQIEISERIESIFVIIENKKQKIKILHKLKASLMQNLLTGKIRVNVDKTNKLLEEV